jgi:hypothetical protein
MVDTVDTARFLMFGGQMPTLVSVQVPEDELESLQDLTHLTDTTMEDSIVAHPFDGLTMVQILLPITAGTVAILRTWISERQKARKEYRIFADGLDLSGYTASEAVRILESLQAPASTQEEDKDPKEPDDRKS